MAKQSPKKPNRRHHYIPPVGTIVEGTPAAEPVANGTALAVPASSAPSTKISLEFGIDNLVAVGVVHAENRLAPRLEQQVGEVHRLGAEITTRTLALQAIYNEERTDPEFEEDCKALVEAADKLGIKLTFELTKANFNPDNMAYSVSVRFNGNMSVTRNYYIENDRAIDLREEIAEMRKQQAEQSKAATRTKSQLNPGWLEKQLRASIAENAMNETPSGADTVKALLTSIDRAIDGAAPVMRQLERD